MKSLLLTLVVLFASVTDLVAQTIDVNNLIKVDLGEYSAHNQFCNASAFLTKDSATVVFYRLEPTDILRPIDKRYNPYLYLFCTTDLMSKLEQVEAKYNEWLSIAIDNKVAPFDKLIDIELPFWFFETEATNNVRKKPGEYDIVKIEDNYKFRFLYKGDGKAILSYLTKDTRNCVLYKYSMIIGFSNMEEFANFQKLLDPENVKTRLREGTTGSLFK